MKHNQLIHWKYRLFLRGKPCPEGHSFCTEHNTLTHSRSRFFLENQFKLKKKKKDYIIYKYQQYSQHVFFFLEAQNSKITESKKGYMFHLVMKHVQKLPKKLFSAEIYTKIKSTKFLSAAKQAFKFCFMLVLNKF